MRRILTMTLLIAAFSRVIVGDPQAAQLPGNTCATQPLGPAVIDIPSVVIQPRFRLNGKAFPGATAGAAVITLWASEPSELFNGPQLVLGETHLPRNPVRVVPGTYDVYYSWIGGSSVPRNQLTRVAQGVELVDDGELVVDIPMIRVTGFKYHNGAAFSNEGTASLSLRGVAWPGEVQLGGTQPALFSVAIIPGRYAFQYNWQQGDNLPRNHNAIVSQVDLLTSVKGVVLNLPSIVQDFEFRHNGVAFPASPYDFGRIFLRRGDREEVLVGASRDQSATRRVIPGSYNVHWRHGQGANIPQNTDAKFKQGLNVNGTPKIIDVPSVEVSGSFTVNGNEPPNSPYEFARIHLVRADGRDSFVLGATRYGGYQKRVIPGVYDIVYELGQGGGTLPSNPRATLTKNWSVEKEPSRDIDIPVGVYKGEFLLNGSNFPQIIQETGRVYAVSSDGDDEPVILGATYYGGFEKRLLPRRYQAAYAHLYGAEVPRNELTTFGPKRTVVAEVELAKTLDVLAGPLTVTYRHNGAAVPEGGPQNMRVHLARGRNYLRLYESIEGTRELVAMTGTFDLFYQFRGGPDLPKNAFMRIGCWILER